MTIDLVKCRYCSFKNTKKHRPKDRYNDHCEKYTGVDATTLDSGCSKFALTDELKEIVRYIDGVDVKKKYSNPEPSFYTIGNPDSFLYVNQYDEDFNIIFRDYVG